MGGEKETTAPQTRNTPSGLERCGTVRYHENQGEIHFHDDANKLKVAMPTGTWFTNFQQLMNSTPSSVRYTDTKNGATIKIATVFKKAKKNKKKKARVELEMFLEPVMVSADIEALQKFTEG